MKKRERDIFDGTFVSIKSQGFICGITRSKESAIDASYASKQGKEKKTIMLRYTR